MIKFPLHKQYCKCAVSWQNFIDYVQTQSGNYGDVPVTEINRILARDFRAEYVEDRQEQYIMFENEKYQCFFELKWR